MNVHGSSPSDWGTALLGAVWEGSENQLGKLRPEILWTDRPPVTLKVGWGMESCPANKNILVPVLISLEDWCDKAESFLHACLPACLDQQAPVIRLLTRSQ